jgi:hypothetical protein
MHSKPLLDCIDGGWIRPKAMNNIHIIFHLRRACWIVRAGNCLWKKKETSTNVLAGAVSLTRPMHPYRYKIALYHTNFVTVETDPLTQRPRFISRLDPYTWTLYRLAKIVATRERNSRLGHVLSCANRPRNPSQPGFLSFL